MEPEIAAEVERRLNVIRDQYRERFTDDEFESIRFNIERSVTAGLKLRACELPNETGPHFDPRAMSRA